MALSMFDWKRLTARRFIPVKEKERASACMNEKEFRHLSRKELVDIIELEKRIEKKMLKLKIFTSS
jgi:hypothetical protein